jgi:XTP/dITP diphosphohydrolase
MATLLIATRNLHKIGEIRAILGDDFVYRTLDDFPDPPAVIEDASTFAGNAVKKAIALAEWLAAFPAKSFGEGVQGNAVYSSSPTAPGKAVPTADLRFVLADDSGLEVDFLKGAPGVHSARFAALDTGQPGNSSSAANNGKLLRLLAGVPPEQRTARFRCVLALTPVLQPALENASPVCYAEETELRTELFEGTCEGRIGFAERGKGGFGYDPLFICDGYEQTFAELGEGEKNRVSHRAKALAKLAGRLAVTGP